MERVKKSLPRGDMETMKKYAGIKLAPIERSIMRVMENAEDNLTAEEIAAGIKYQKQDRINFDFVPILERLLDMGYLRRAGLWKYGRG